MAACHGPPLGVLVVELPHLLECVVLKTCVAINALVHVSLKQTGDLWEALGVLGEEIFYPQVPNNPPLEGGSPPPCVCRAGWNNKDKLSTVMVNVTATVIE